MLKRVGGISQECVQNGGDRGKDQTRVQPARCLTPLQGLPGMLGARLGQKPGAVRGSPTVGYQLSHPWETPLANATRAAHLRARPRRIRVFAATTHISTEADRRVV